MSAIRLLFLMSVVLAVTGCGTCFKDSKPWLGSSEHELVAAWGKPDQTTQREDGGRVLTWTVAGDVCRRSFVVNPGGTVVFLSGHGFDTGPHEKSKLTISAQNIYNVRLKEPATRSPAAERYAHIEAIVSLVLEVAGKYKYQDLSLSTRPGESVSIFISENLGSRWLSDTGRKVEAEILQRIEQEYSDKVSIGKER